MLMQSLSVSVESFVSDWLLCRMHCLGASSPYLCCCRGHEFGCIDGVMRRIYPMLAVWAADLLEAASLYLVRPGASSMPDVNYLVGKADLAKLHPPLERRTEEHTQQVDPFLMP